MRGARCAVRGHGLQGIGQGIALCLGERGARVLCVDLESQRGIAAATVDQINASRGAAAFFAADLSKWGDVEAMVAHAVALFGSVDISVAAVGAGPRCAFLDETPASYMRTVQITQHSAW